MDSNLPLSADRLSALMKDPDVVLIDVRPRDEYEFDHIPGAWSIPIEELEQTMAKLPKDKRIVAYCRGRYCLFAAEAVQILRRHGYRAIRVEQGVREWRRSTSVSGGEECRMIFRQYLHEDPIAASYLLGCGSESQGAVVDPMDDVEFYIQIGRVNAGK